jgi:hypothetical protein
MKTSEEEKTNVAEKEAFKLLTICGFIASRTPMVLGYAEHNHLINVITQLSVQLGNTHDTGEVIDSEEWQTIRKILNI